MEWRARAHTCSTEEKSTSRPEGLRRESRPGRGACVPRMTVGTCRFRDGWARGRTRIQSSEPGCYRCTLSVPGPGPAAGWKQDWEL